MFSFRKKYHLVFVCTANRTRSAYLEGYLNHFLGQYRPGSLKRVRITSAGTHAVAGGRVNDVVALLARNRGFSLRQHAAVPLTGRLVRRADLLLVMEQVHKDFILERWPEAGAKVFRLMEYGWQPDPEVATAEVLDVPDPTGKNAEDFAAFIETAHAETDRLVHELVHREIL